jgi:hypothetical protein
MALEEALSLVQQTRSFVGTIYSREVVLDSKFKPQSSIRDAKSPLRFPYDGRMTVTLGAASRSRLRAIGHCRRPGFSRG